MNEFEQKQQEIRNLICYLSSSASDIGDWKVIKIYEARLCDEDDPYDATELMAARQAVRDQINALQAELSTMENNV